MSAGGGQSSSESSATQYAIQSGVSQGAAQQAAQAQINAAQQAAQVAQLYEQLPIQSFSDAGFNALQGTNQNVASALSGLQGNINTSLIYNNPAIQTGNQALAQLDLVNGLPPVNPGPAPVAPTPISPTATPWDIGITANSSPSSIDNVTSSMFQDYVNAGLKPEGQTAPTLQTPTPVTQQDITNYIMANTSSQPNPPGVGTPGYLYTGVDSEVAQGPFQAMANPFTPVTGTTQMLNGAGDARTTPALDQPIRDAVQQYLTQQNAQNAQQQYQQAQNAYNQAINSSIISDRQNYASQLLNDQTTNNTANSIYQDQLNQYNQQQAVYNSYQQQYAQQQANPGTNPILTYLKSLPGYQFQQQQGQQAIENQLSAQGLGNSGALLKDLSTFNNQLSNTYYNQYVSGLQQLAGVAQTPTTNVSNLLGTGGTTGASILNNASNTNTSNYLNTGTGISATQGLTTEALANSLLAQGQAKASSYLLPLVNQEDRILPVGQSQSSTNASTSGSGIGGIGSILSGLGSVGQGGGFGAILSSL